MAFRCSNPLLVMGVEMTASFVLIILLTFGGRGAAPADFYTLSACENARKEIEKIAAGAASVQTKCVPK